MSDVAPETPGPAAGDADAAAAGPPATGPAPEAAAAPAAPAYDPASTAGMLASLTATLPPESIDELWIFPPRRIGAGQSTVVVASVFGDPDDEERRRIFTTRFTVTRGPKGQPELSRETTEDGAAPAERVGRVVDGVLRRLEEEPAPPRHARLEGSPERWQELLRVVAAAEVG